MQLQSTKVAFRHLSKKETESEGVGRLSTCNREAVQAVCEVLRLVVKETSCGRQQEAAASHSSKRTKECERAGGSKRAKACKRGKCNDYVRVQREL